MSDKYDKYFGENADDPNADISYNNRGGGREDKPKTKRKYIKPKIIGFRIGALGIALKYPSINPSSQEEQISKIHSLLSRDYKIAEDICLSPDRRPYHSKLKGKSSSGHDMRIHSARCAGFEYPVYIDFYGKFFEKYDYEKALEIIAKISQDFGLIHPVVCRLDGCIDLVGIKFTRKNLKGFSTALGGALSYPSDAKKQLESLTYGKGKKCQVIFYNKTLELERTNRDISDLYPDLSPNTEVWRIEYRVKRSWLRKHGWTSPEYILPKAKEVLGHLMKYSVSYRNRNRKVARFWKKLIDQLGTDIPPPQPEKSIPFHERDWTRNMMGNFAYFANCTGIYDPAQICTRIMSDYQSVLLERGLTFPDLIEQKRKEISEKGGKK